MRGVAYLDLVWHYALQYLKERWEYRVDLLVGLLADLCVQALRLATLVVVFAHVPSLQGWRPEEVIFINGYFTLPMALFSATTGSLWDLHSRYVVQGEMDRVLVRPVPPFLQVLLEGLELESLLGLVTGGAMMAWAAGRLGLEWRWWDGFLLVLAVTGSYLILLGVYGTLAAVAFWTDSRTNVLTLTWNLNQFARYPVDVYRRAVRWFLTFVLPFAFVAAYPAGYFLRREGWLAWALATPVVGAVALAVALAAWRRGLRRYVGAGS